MGVEGQPLATGCSQPTEAMGEEAGPSVGPLSIGPLQASWLPPGSTGPMTRSVSPETPGQDPEPDRQVLSLIHI
jgi:hypothetical protein